MENTTEEEFEGWLKELIDVQSEELGLEITTNTYEDLGMLTTNNGLVVRREDGSEFQITIVKSR